MAHHAHPQPKQRSWFARHKVLTGAGALVAVIAIGSAAAGGGDGDDKPTAASAGKGTDAGNATDKSADKNSDSVKKKADMSGSGTYQIGKDVKPGTYRSTGNKLGCYWERAKDSKGEMDSILANDNVVGPAYVTIADGDKLFKTRGCKGWNLVTDEKSGTPKSEVPGNGMYRVGVDIAPGTYKADGNKSGCYWERDKDALHGMDSIEANENITGSGIVTITPQDAYFKTNGCAAWKKTA
ncbi:hypothetical protein [Streptomyces sp. NPDC051173]|uniref:hypothetical protein n=1 Tax=Streptomyces sp. NPDC051173 TaxID=3155164 RepID=UPI00344FE941